MVGHVSVCDAPMGFGKSTAAINYMNAHPDRRYLYISPLSTEAERIAERCPTLNFVLPREKIPKFGWTKAGHVLDLLDRGRNIASTHQATMYFTEDTYRLLREKNYVIIIDEEVAIFQQLQGFSADDIEILIRAGYINKSENGECTRTDMPYTGGKFRHLFRLMQSRKLIMIKDSGARPIFYLAYQPDMFRNACDVIVLTYMFAGSEMDSLFKMNGIEYDQIGVHIDENGDYQFSDHPEPPRSYFGHLDRLIHIEQNEKLNEIGNDRTALSMSWYKHGSEAEYDRLRRNMNSFFQYWTPKNRQRDRMCGTFIRFWDSIRDSRRNSSTGVAFNKKATNEYRDRRYLAYMVNVYLNVVIKNYYNDLGYPLDEDRYALSTLVQWIWRSAIRDGDEIWIYIPSKRMREILETWIASVCGGGDTAEEA